MKNFILLICLTLPMLGFADTPMGEKLTFKLWKDIKAKQIKKIAHYTSQKFQAADLTQTYTRTQYLQNLNNYSPIQSYQLLNVQTTQGENVITVTYLATITSVAVDDLPGFITSEWIIDVWKKQDDHWRWVSEASFPLLTS